MASSNAVNEAKLRAQLRDAKMLALVAGAFLVIGVIAVSIARFQISHDGLVTEKFHAFQTLAIISFCAVGVLGLWTVWLAARPVWHFRYLQESRIVREFSRLRPRWSGRRLVLHVLFTALFCGATHWVIMEVTGRMLAVATQASISFLPIQSPDEALYFSIRDVRAGRVVFLHPNSEYLDDYFLGLPGTYQKLAIVNLERHNAETAAQLGWTPDAIKKDLSVFKTEQDRLGSLKRATMASVVEALKPFGNSVLISTQLLPAGDISIKAANNPKLTVRIGIGPSLQDRLAYRIDVREDQIWLVRERSTICLDLRRQLIEQFFKELRLPKLPSGSYWPTRDMVDHDLNVFIAQMFAGWLIVLAPFFYLRRKPREQ